MIPFLLWSIIILGGVAIVYTHVKNYAYMKKNISDIQKSFKIDK